MAGGVLIKEDQPGHRDDAAGNRQTFAYHPARGQRDDEEKDARGDDEERPAIVSDVDPHELTGEQDGPDENQQSPENRRLAARWARHLASGGFLDGWGAWRRSFGHAPTLSWGGLPSRGGGDPSPAPSMLGDNRSSTR